MYVARGTADIVLDQQRITVRAGDVLLIGSGVAHSTSFQEKEACDIWTLSAAGVEFGDQAEGRMVSVHTRAGKHAAFIEESMKRIEAFSRDMDLPAQIACNHLCAALFALFQHMMHPTTGHKKRNRTLPSDVLTFINEHYAQDIDLDLLGKTFFTSASHISREFKRAHGISPINYLIDKRLSDAKWLLINTVDPVQAVAEKVGYQNVYYFIKLFGRRVGYSPLEYREKYGTSS